MLMVNSILEAMKETGIMLARVLDWESKSSSALLSFCILSDYRNINIPWPSQGMGDGDYMYAFQQVVMPIATEFDPDLVIGKPFLVVL
jgi:hypothetical protein